MRQKQWDLNQLEDRLQLRAIQRRRPLSCTLELTCQCNFQCRMCYVRMSPAQAAAYGRMRTVDEWLEMARQLLDAGVLYLTLTGGECTLYPGFTALYEQLAQMGFIITVMSNAAAYTDAVREVFRRFPPRAVGVTLYGGSPEAYQAVTGDAGGYERVLSNIRYLLSIGVRVVLNFTMIRANALDYPKVGRLCRELGVPWTLITDITGHRYDPAFSDALGCRLTPAERACVACHPPEEVALALENAQALEKELADFRLPEAPPGAPETEQDSCIGAATGAAIGWNGDMHTCISMLGSNPVHPFETGFEAAWAQLKAQQDTTFCRPAACAACAMAADCLHNCAGRRFEGSGSPHKPDPYTCQYTWLLRRYRSRREAADMPPTPPCA